MPDPKRKTVSATEASQLLNRSPYGTRFTLYNRFTGRTSEADQKVHSRMTWGLLMQPLIADEFAKAFPHIKLRGFKSRPYIRRDVLGYTGDLIGNSPELGGWGSVEIKCVFDYQVWMRDWNGGDNPPEHYETQLQTQMRVGTGRGEPFQWGVIVAWVGADLYYFWRAPLAKLQDQLASEAGAFLKQVAEEQEPNPLGDPMELEELRDVYPYEEDSVLDLRDDPAAWELMEMCRMLEFHKKRERVSKGAAQHFKAKLVAACHGNQRLLLPGRHIFEAKKSKSGALLTKVVQLPGWEKEKRPPDVGAELFA